MKGVQETNISWVWELDRKKSSREIRVWHHSSSLVMEDNGPRDGFFLSTSHTNDKSL